MGEEAPWQFHLLVAEICLEATGIKHQSIKHHSSGTQLIFH